MRMHTVPGGSRFLACSVPELLQQGCRFEGSGLEETELITEQRSGHK